MPAFLGFMAVVGGFFLFFWYRTVVSLPMKKQPLFIHSRLFKWGVPVISVLLFTGGLLQLLGVNRWLAFVMLACAILLSFLAVKFDRYSAEARIIHDHYRNVRAANPGMDEMEVLFLTARWRYPQWPHDRIVELVAGKDVENLIVLMLINENKINPVSDWELYRSMKAKVTRIVGQPARSGDSPEQRQA